MPPTAMALADAHKSRIQPQLLLQHKTSPRETRRGERAAPLPPPGTEPGSGPLGTRALQCCKRAFLKHPIPSALGLWAGVKTPSTDLEHLRSAPGSAGTDHLSLSIELYSLLTFS